MEWYWILLVAAGAAGLLYVLFSFTAAWIFSRRVLYPRGRQRRTYDEMRSEQQSLEHVDFTRYERFDKECFRLPAAGAQLSCVLVRNPQNTGRREKCVILCHGYTKNLLACVKYGYIFYDLGYSILLYDHRGFGESQGGPCTLGHLEKSDLSAVVGEAKRRLGEDTLIGVHGESLGAISAMLALEIDDRIDFLVEDSGASEIRGFAGQAFKTYAKISPGLTLPLVSLVWKALVRVSMADLRPVGAVARSDVPILFLHGRDDRLIPAEMCEELYAAARSPLSKMVIFEGVGHARSYHSDNRRYTEIIAGWLADVVPREPCIITAHAGALDTQANTLESLQTCLEFLGGSCVEVDVRFDAQGVPILTHDAPGPGEQPALLEDFFALLQNFPARVNLDIKDPANLPEIQRLGGEYGVLPRLFFTGISALWAGIVREDAPRIPYYINKLFPGDAAPSGDELRALAEEIKRLGGVGLNTRYQSASREMAELMRANGLLCSVWTVDGEADMRRMLCAGVDNITTRRPDVLRSIISENNHNC